MAKKPVERRVSELHAECSYPMRPDAVAASDNCRGHATSVVTTPDGRKLYRCKGHRGLISGTTKGTASDTIMVTP